MNRFRRCSVEQLNDPDISSLLGLKWNLVTDEFSSIQVWSMAVPMKRTVTSMEGHYDDPVGLLAPVIVTAIVFLLSMWQEKLDWDTLSPMDLEEEQLEFLIKIGDGRVEGRDLDSSVVQVVKRMTCLTVLIV